MNFLQKSALVLTIVGGLNWGLIGFFNFDLVAFLFGGGDTFLSHTVYALVGLAAITNLALLAVPIKD